VAGVPAPGRIAAIATLVLFALGGVMVAKTGMGMKLVGTVDTMGPSNPLMATAKRLPAHGWPIMACIPG
jgi:cytochrome d ubiquinol oxidase subunit II